MRPVKVYIHRRGASRCVSPRTRIRAIVYVRQVYEMPPQPLPCQVSVGRRVDAMSCVVLLLTGVYMLQRGCKLDDGEFGALLLFLVIVLALVVAHRRRHPLCFATAAKRQNTGRERFFDEENENENEEEEDTGVAYGLASLPGRLKALLDPRMRDLAKGFRGDPIFPDPVTVGDGQQEAVDKERKDGDEDDDTTNTVSLNESDYVREGGMSKPEFERMANEYRRIDYALCRLKFKHNDAYRKLMALDWL